MNDINIIEYVVFMTNKKSKNTTKNKMDIIENAMQTDPLHLPFVSICTPTFNRRPFIPLLIKCIEQQNYPKNKMEWVIVDDGTDPIEDIVKDIDWIIVKYLRYDKQLLLGNKRNIMHSKCVGDIIVYMDDDDYYPPERVSHAVDSLIKNPGILLAGSSEMHIYYHDINKLYQCGPYGKYHSTAATFAFRKELLSITQYDNENALAEENVFLKKYTIPLIQLDSLKTILVIAHSHNSYDKKKLLETPIECKISPSKYIIEEFITDSLLRDMYTKNIHTLLDKYVDGTPDHKPEIIKQMNQLKEIRETRILEHKKKVENYNILKNLQINNNISSDLQEIKNRYEKIIEDKTCLINELLKKIKELTKALELSELKSS